MGILIARKASLLDLSFSSFQNEGCILSGVRPTSRFFACFECFYYGCYWSCARGRRQLRCGNQIFGHSLCQSGVSSGSRTTLPSMRLTCVYCKSFCPPRTHPGVPEGITCYCLWPLMPRSAHILCGTDEAVLRSTRQSSFETSYSAW